MQRPARRRLTRAAIILTAWLALSVLGSALNGWVWSANGAEHAGSIAKASANAMQLLITPGLVLVKGFLGRWGVGNPVATFAGHLLGWGLWIFALFALWEIRRFVRERLNRPAAAEGVNATHTTKPLPANPARRALLFDLAGAGVGLLGAGSVARAAAVDPWDLRLRTYEVPIRDLPRSLDGLRIGHVSDTHLGPRIPEAFVRSGVERVLDAGVDLVLLNGDYIHNGTYMIEPGADAVSAACDRARVPLGAIGVLGNHDWYADGHAMARALTARGVRMIDNDRVYLDARTRTVTRTQPDEGLCIAGVGDLREDHVDLSAALAGVHPDMPRLLLSHNPDVAEMPALADRLYRVDLMLSGHTHGGQVSLPFLGAPGVPSDYGQKYAGGLVEGPGCRVLISRGVGMSILPVRFGVPPEVAVISLRCADESANAPSS